MIETPCQLLKPNTPLIVAIRSFGMGMYSRLIPSSAAVAAAVVVVVVAVVGSEGEVEEGSSISSL